MPPKKNPLGDARKRLQEKIDSIKEQSEYITHVLTTTVNNAVDPAIKLLNQKDRKKFFNKYSQVSQDLEKCLDFLLVLSDSVAASGDSSNESGSSDEEADSNADLEDKETKKKKENKEKTCKELKKVETSPQEKKPENEEKPTQLSVSSGEPKSNQSSNSEIKNKGASPTDISTNGPCAVSEPGLDSCQPRQNKKSPHTSSQNKQAGQDGVHKHIKREEKHLNSDKPSFGYANRENAQGTTRNKMKREQQSSGKSPSISPLQESAIKRFVPSQIKMPRAYQEEEKTIDVPGKGRTELPVQVRKGQSFSEGNHSAGRKSPAQLVPKKAASAVQRGSPPKVFQLKPYPFTNSQCLEVVVTEVLSPWELWIQPTGNEFNLLMEKMCMQFAKAAASGYKGGLSSPPSVGEYCCARFTIDDTWYRARVVGLHQSEDSTKRPEGRRQRNSSSSSTSSIDNSHPGLEIEVLCIDDGNRERLPLNRLRQLDENLAEFPCQALCCALAGVKPLIQNTVKTQGDSVWKENAIEWLRNKVSGTKLLAYPKKVDNDPLIMVDLYLPPSRRKTSNTKGKDGTLPGLQHSIANIMVMEGFAQRVDHMNTDPDDSKNTSPRSVSSEGVLSRSCSSLSVASLQDSAMPVFEEPVTQSNTITQSSTVTQTNTVTQCNTVTQTSNVKSNSAAKQASAEGSPVLQDRGVTQGSAVTKHNLNVEQSVTRGIRSHDSKMVDGDQTSHTEAEIHIVTQRQSQNSISSENPGNRNVKDLEEKPVVTQSTPNQEIENVYENDSMVKRESPRVPPEGSSLTEYLDDQQDLNKEYLTDEDNKRLYLPTQDQPLLLQVMMSEIISPNQFYVHLVTPEAVLLAELTEDLDSYYKDSDVTSTPADYRLGIGDYCCSKYTDDNMWCRAQVIDVKISPGDGGESFSSHDSEALTASIHVFYVDYGNSEWVAMENTRPLLPKFMMLPGFAVRCRLAGVKPAANQDENTTMPTNDATSPLESETTKTDTKNTTDTSDSSTSQVTPNPSAEITDTKTADKGGPKTDEKDGKLAFRISSTKNEKKVPKGRRGKKYREIVLDKNVIQRAAGDESGDSELSDGGLSFDWPEGGHEETKEKTEEEEESALPEKYLLPSPDKKPYIDDVTSPNTEETIKHEWNEEAIELFKGLTGDDKPLRGVMVPWNARVYQQVYYPTASRQDSSSVDITYERPTLAIKLYDTTGEEDIDVAQVLIDTGLAELCEVQEEECITMKGEAKTVRLSLKDLENTADQLEREGAITSPVGSVDSGSPSRSSSPDESALQFWNPMMEDFVSSRNTYRINTDDLDIAIHGFKPIENQVCRFFQSTRSKCWRGQNCPLLHIKKGEDASMMIQAFCENNDFTVDLPEPDSWVGVHVTAVLNPGHFWVQFPCGSGPIEKTIMEARLGLSFVGKEKQDEDDDFDTMAEKMNKFYSRNLFRDSSSVLPAMGELVVAKYSGNDRWYRARVTDVMDGEFQVCFVDYGNTEWTAEANVKRMLPQFLHLPFQAVECFLANVESVDEDGAWSTESCEAFESLTQDKLLIAHVLSIGWNNTMYVELFDTQKDEEVNINEEMIKQGFALETAVRIAKPRHVEPTDSNDSSDCEIYEIPGPRVIHLRIRFFV